MRLCVVAAIALLVSACEGDECEIGQTRCLGDTLEACRQGTWERQDCAGACFLSGDHPICSLLPEPDPSCGTLPATCVEPDTRIDCVDGWRITEKRCDTDGGCVEFDAPNQYYDDVAHRAVCSLEAEQDPMCDPGIYDGYCATPNTAITCWGGYVIQRDECKPRAATSGRDSCYDHGSWVVCTTPVVSHEGSEYGN